VCGYTEGIVNPSSSPSTARPDGGRSAPARSSSTSSGAGSSSMGSSRRLLVQETEVDSGVFRVPRARQRRHGGHGSPSGPLRTEHQQVHWNTTFEAACASGSFPVSTSSRTEQVGVSRPDHRADGNLAADELGPGRSADRL
jgi:hypothetical protein